MTVSLTQKAAAHIQAELARRGKGLGIRLGTKTTGCSGIGYTIEFVDQSEATDERFESFGVAVYVDQKSLPYLAGVSIDYVKEGLQEGLKFNNPNAQNTCGCGKSFHV